MGGHTTPAVLGPLASITLLPLYFELDGTFPNHEANPLDPANLVDLQRHVVETGADIGLAFDGDADRCFVVDELGQPVSPSAVTALVAGRELGREIGAHRHPQPDHLARGARADRRARRHRHPLAGRALLHQGADGRVGRDLRRRALRALLLPRLLGRRLRHAGRAARARGAGRAGPAAVGADGRLPALRGLRRDQLHRGRRAGVRRCGAEVASAAASTPSTTSTASPSIWATAAGSTCAPRTPSRCCG